MSWTRPRRALVAAVIAAWVFAGVWGSTAYVSAYWYQRGFAPVTWPAHVPHGRTERVRFFSPTLGGQASYIVHLPAGYAAAARQGRRFSVFYVLHGSPGNARLLLTVSGAGPYADTLAHRGAIRPMIIVAPQGDDSYFSDTEWANTRAGRWAAELVDVVHNVDARFATYANRAHRSIGGLSEGGYGALNVALTHLNLFSVAESWSGYFTQTPTGVFAHARPTQIAAASPAHYVPGMAARLRHRPTHVLLYDGRGDRHFVPATFFGFARELRAAGAHVRTRVYRGGHNWALWRREMPMSLRFASRWMGA
jgi:enterochelin esterase-like enzyme